MGRLIQKIQALRCDFFHGGGTILRDSQGRINWRCNCGRWSDHPVSLRDEARVIDSHIAKAKEE